MLILVQLHFPPRTSGQRRPGSLCPVNDKLTCVWTQDHKELKLPAASRRCVPVPSLLFTADAHRESDRAGSLQSPDGEPARPRPAGFCAAWRCRLAPACPRHTFIVKRKWHKVSSWQPLHQSDWRDGRSLDHMFKIRRIRTVNYTAKHGI